LPVALYEPAGIARELVQNVVDDRDQIRLLEAQAPSRTGWWPSRHDIQHRPGRDASEMPLGIGRIGPQHREVLRRAREHDLRNGRCEGGARKIDPLAVHGDLRNEPVELPVSICHELRILRHDAKRGFGDELQRFSIKRVEQALARIVEHERKHGAADGAHQCGLRFSGNAEKPLRLGRREMADTR
jgi:hypothetical protein